MSNAPDISQCLEALRFELVRSQEIFESLRNQNRVRGTFTDSRWEYKGAHINFTFTSGPLDELPLEGKVADTIARSLITRYINQGKSGSRIIGLMLAIKVIAQDFQDNVQFWALHPSARLNDVVKRVGQGHTVRTQYMRASDMVTVLKHLRLFEHRSGPRRYRLVLRNGIWRHGLPNPIGKALDPTSPEYEAHSKKKFKPDLHVAIGRARYRLAENPAFEPKPGFDRIRLESFGFAICFGTRIGEVSTLPCNAVDVDDRSGIPFARIFTEKGSPPSARVLPEMWAPALVEAHNYLLAACASARQRAREIEVNGFTFIWRRLEQYRAKHPLTPGEIAQLNLTGFGPKYGAFLHELSACFDVSMFHFNVGERRFLSLSVPGPSWALVIEGFDTRMETWQWADLWPGKDDPWKPLSLDQIAESVGIHSSILKQRGRPHFRDFITQAREKFIAAGGPHLVSCDIREELEREWQRVKNRLFVSDQLTRVVNVGFWIEYLERTYNRYLERHYKEQIANFNEPLSERDPADFSPKGRSDDRSGGGFASQPLSEHLIVVWEDQFMGITPHMGVLPRPIFQNDYHRYLSGSCRQITIFQRLEILGENGAPFSFTSHMARHWVTDTLHRSGSPEMLVDVWMGRKPGQARHYDHRTAKERAETARARYLAPIPPDDYFGRRIVRWREEGLDEVSIRRFVSSRLVILHFTPWGACSRELTTMPCDRGLMCLRGFGTQKACKSFHIDPTDMVARASIEALRSKYMMLLRVIEPEEEEIRRLLTAEFNSAESLDRHLKHIVSMINGCTAALLAYDIGIKSGHIGSVRVTDGQLVPEGAAA